MNPIFANHAEVQRLIRSLGWVVVSEEEQEEDHALWLPE